MESTKQKLPENVTIFFKNLSKLLETKLLFFGSVQRQDYFPGNSDIDVDIFTENISSTLAKMQHFLHINKKKFKKIIWRLNDEKKTFVRGYKVMYNSPDGLFSAEFSIYDEKFKQDVLREHLMKTKLPFYAYWMLIAIKFLYYKLKLLSRETFTYLKKKIMSLMIGLPDDQFIVLDSNIETIKYYDYDVL